MKNVLLLVHDDVGQEARFQAALDLTRALDGHLDCIEAISLPVVVDGFGGGGVAVLMEDEREREAANRARLEPRLAAEGVSWSWTDAIGYLPECVLNGAKTADVIVLNRQLDMFPGPDMRQITTEVLTNTNALVVAVADSCPRFDAAGKVLIAWDGSRRIMATIQRAVPLLALASEVKLLQVGDLREDDIAIEDAATYLSRHGIKVDAEIVPEAESITTEIRLAADRFGAGYVLMGAYKHRPVREALFGGVTRAMLTACNVPLVMGH